MNHLEELISKLCPEGVPYRAVSEISFKGEKIKWKNVQGQSFKYIDLASVDRVTRIIGETAEISSADAPSRAQQIVRSGDVIFATTRPTQMRWAVIPEEFDGQIASTGYCVIRPDSSQVLTNFVAHILSADKFQKYIEQNQVLGNYPSIPDGAIRDYKVPVPPMEVQLEIVRILDAMTSLQAELQAELQARRKQYEYYRNKLLSFAAAN